MRADVLGVALVAVVIWVVVAILWGPVVLLAVWGAITIVALLVALWGTR